MFPISTMFTATEIECLVCTAAELWATSGDIHDILGAYQTDLLARAHDLLTEDEDNDAPPSGSPETAFVIAHQDPVPFALDEPAFQLDHSGGTGSRETFRAFTTRSRPVTWSP